MPGFRAVPIVFALLTGCAPDTGDKGGADGAQPAADHPAPAAPGSAAWVVGPRGAGPVRVGMTVAEAGTAIGEVLGGGGGPDSLATCRYAVSGRAPAGVAFMVVDGQVARVDVDSGATATAEGARVGDSEERVRALYAGRVAVTPHKYTDGHYLTVRPAAPADSGYRLVFETDGKRVTEYRAGQLLAVDWVEGCS